MSERERDRDRKPPDQGAESSSPRRGKDGEPGIDSEVLRVQKLAGNRAASRLIAEGDVAGEAGASVRAPASRLPGGRPVPEDLRERAEAELGVDLSDVRIHTDGESADAVGATGARAATLGGDIVVAPGEFDLGTGAGRRLVEHELTHVAQQATGRTGTLEGEQAEERRSAKERRLEDEAEAGAASGERAPGAGRGATRDKTAAASGPRPTAAASTPGSATPVVQAFDPEAHRRATVEGLSGAFTPASIGRVYRANWERDLAQAAPEIADAIIAWKAVKESTKGGTRPPSDEAAKQFNEALSRLLAAMSFPGVFSLLDETYGGTRYWTHMDNPGGSEAKDAEKRWQGARKTEGDDIPAYLKDSRAYVKEQIALAVKEGRREKDSLDEGVIAEAWEGAAKPKGYGEAKKVREPKLKSTPVEDEATGLALKVQRGERLVEGFEPVAVAGGAVEVRDPAAQHLGRATHAMEDFFAHSNFVELAEETSASGKPVPAGRLATGTFTEVDKLYSFSHKIHAMVGEMRKEQALIGQVLKKGPLADKTTKDPAAGRSSITGAAVGGGLALGGIGAAWGAIGGVLLAGGGPVLGGIAGGIGGGVLGAGLGGALGLKWGGRAGLYAGAVVGGILGAVGGALLGALAGPVAGMALLGGTAGLAVGAIDSASRTARDVAPQVLTSERLLLELDRKADGLETWARSKADEGSHSKLAKDQPGRGTDAAALERTRGYETAVRLSAEANAAVMREVRLALLSPTAAEAAEHVRNAYRIVDQLVTVPSRDHPLIGVVRGARARPPSGGEEK